MPKTNEERPKSKVLGALSLRERLAHELRQIRGDWIESIIDAGEKTVKKEDLLIPYAYWFPISYQRNFPFYVLEESDQKEDLELADRIIKVLDEEHES